MGFFLKNCVVLWNMTSAMIILVLCSPDAFADSLCQNFDWYFWPLRTTRNDQCCTSMLCRILSKKKCKKEAFLLLLEIILYLKRLMGIVLLLALLLFSRFLSRKFIVIRSLIHSSSQFSLSAKVSQQWRPLFTVLGWKYLSAAFL